MNAVLQCTNPLLWDVLHSYFLRGKRKSSFIYTRMKIMALPVPVGTKIKIVTLYENFLCRIPRISAVKCGKCRYKLFYFISRSFSVF